MLSAHHGLVGECVIKQKMHGCSSEKSSAVCTTSDSKGPAEIIVSCSPMPPDRSQSAKSFICACDKSGEDLSGSATGSTAGLIFALRTAALICSTDVFFKLAEG
jgi:hypothetical protein